MKHILSIVVLILVTATVSLLSQPQLDKSRELIKQKNFTEAVNVCKAYIQSNQNDENAWLILAEAFQRAGLKDSAENAARKVVQLDDEMLEGYTILAKVQLEKKDIQGAYKTAKAGLKTIGKKQQKFPPLLVVLGQTLLATDSADAALIVASEAKEIDSKNANAYEVIGDAYVKQRVAPMAISSYEKSLEVDSLQPQVLYKLANAYLMERQYTEAARVYIRILALDPNNKAARLELANLYSRVNRSWAWVKCAETLKDYLINETNPSKEIESLYLKALLRGGQYKEAAKEAEVYSKKYPNSTLANRAIANGYYNEKKYAQAVEFFKKIDTLEFEDNRFLGEAYYKIKKDTLAARAWEDAVDDTTESLNVRSYYIDRIAYIWMSQRSYERAAQFYQKRIQVDSSALGAYINYAQCMMQLERFKDAESYLKMAIAKNPKVPSAYVSLGFCYVQMKEMDMGEDEFRKAIKIIDTAETKYKTELADSYRMIGLSTMVKKKVTEEESKQKWETAVNYLKKSLKYKEDVAQTHLLLGQCYQNLGNTDDAVKEYRRALKLDPKNKEAKKGLEMLGE
jgi:tetratricopeptide (TPR) repeat protein